VRGATASATHKPLAGALSSSHSAVRPSVHPTAAAKHTKNRRYAKLFNYKVRDVYNLHACREYEKGKKGRRAVRVRSRIIV